MKGLGHLLGPYGSGKHSKGRVELAEAYRRRKAGSKMQAASRRKNRTRKNAGRKKNRK